MKYRSICIDSICSLVLYVYAVWYPIEMQFNHYVGTFKNTVLFADDFMSVTTFHRAIQYGDLNDIRKFVRER